MLHSEDVLAAVLRVCAREGVERIFFFEEMMVY